MEVNFFFFVCLLALFALKVLAYFALAARKTAASCTVQDTRKAAGDGAVDVVDLELVSGSGQQDLGLREPTIDFPKAAHANEMVKVSVHPSPTPAFEKVWV